MEDGRVTTEFSGGGDPRRSIELLWRLRERPRPGPKPRFTVDDVAAAAIAIADAEGLAALSMRRVAERLGVAAMSLYTYVPGKAELIDLMLDTVCTEVPPADARRLAGSAGRDGPVELAALPAPPLAAAGGHGPAAARPQPGREVRPRAAGDRRDRTDRRGDGPGRAVGRRLRARRRPVRGGRHAGGAAHRADRRAVVGAGRPGAGKGLPAGELSRPRPGSARRPAPSTTRPAIRRAPSSSAWRGCSTA